MATATVDRKPAQQRVLRRGLRMLVEYARMHPWTMGVAIGGAAVYAGCTVLSAVVLGRVTDAVLVPAFREGVDRLTVAGGVTAILAVAVVRSAGIVVRRYFAGVTRARVSRDLRRRVLATYQGLPVAYFRSRPTGELLAHAHADVEVATEVIGPLPYSTAVVMLIVIATVLLVVTDPLLAAIGVALLPGVTILNRVFVARLEGPAARAQEHVGAVSAVAHESIDGALVVKTLGREADEVRRFAARAERLRDERIAMGRVRSRFEPLLDALPDGGMVALLALGAWRVSTGAVSTGTLVQFLALFQLLAFPMRLIGYLLGDMVRAVVGRDRLEGVFAERAGLAAATAATSSGAGETVRLPGGPLSVAAEDVWFSYPAGAPVLRHLDLEVPAGAAVAVTGQTGSGKSTLVELLARLAHPQSGRVRLGGVDLRHAVETDVRGAVATVFQESFLFGTTVRDNITLGEPYDDDAVHDAARLAQAAEFIEALPHGYDTRVGERGVTLSGGQRQRVALARALLRRPRLLILDDATSAVDPLVEAAILEGLRRTSSATLVVVAYRVSTIRLADSVLLLEGGRVGAAGTHDELLAHPGYAALLRAYQRREGR